MIDFFPLGTAIGSAFCNRADELHHLKMNIQYIKPTLIMSPRRYGKTSLVLQAFSKNNIKFSHIDLYKEVNEEGVELAIINGIGELLGKLEPTHKKLLKLASELFSDLQVKLNLGTEKIRFSIEIAGGKRKSANNILTALQKLDELAEKRKETVALFIDEFQQLSEITGDTSVEAAIRQVAQLSKHVVYIFSGSNRHLLEAMFFDKKRPFYKLCDLIKLERITDEHYYDYIPKAIQEMSGHVIGKEGVGMILELTENHPYYVNLLCSKLINRKEFSVKTICQCWSLCADESKAQLERELGLFSFNQRKLYIGLAKLGKTQQPTNQKTLETIGLTSASLLQALQVLKAKDYIIQDQDGYYKILDPLHKYIIAG